MNDSQIEEFRNQLQEGLRKDYFDKLKNDDDPSAERYELIGTVSYALERLLELETMFLTETLTDNDDGICPSCLIKDATDVANLKVVALGFNNYLQATQNMHD